MTKEHVRGKSEDGIIQNSEGLKRSKTHSRREVLVGSAAAGALVIVRGEPAAAAREDLHHTIAAGTLLANLVTDAFRKATKADIALNANGAMRAGLMRGKSGVVTVYDVFAVAPLGAGAVDSTAGSALVTAYLHRPGGEAHSGVPAHR